MSNQVIVLVVDDVALVRRVLRRAIGRVHPDALVLESVSVAEARQVLQHIHVGAVITDYNLPDGTGLDVLSSAHARHADVPVIVVSSDASVSGLVLASGAVAFLEKPLDISVLLETLERL